jgi:hypothetical protein
MSKSYRIRTTPGGDNGFLKVNVDLNQNYDFLEILSLKISQKDAYQNFCSDYGVVAGRVILNDGFGVPNVRVSIFVPVDENDLNDPVKSALYPYTEPFPDQKNANGIRYNVLPKNQQSLDHTPIGTFPKKREILDNNTTLEIYEKYYKYTTTTNEAGDYILFGVPVGDHFLHYDMDVSDIGFLSARPFELIENGYSDNLFKDRFKFKSSNNLDSLPQVFSENIPISVEPYWCDSLSVGSALGINRYDIQPNYEVIPQALFMGSVFTDDEKDSLNKNCKPAREMGKLNEVITGGGKIEAIRRTVDGNIEKFSFKDTSIDENGNWSVLVPMNLRKVITDEFGNLIPSPDGIKGVATEGDYRFRISMDATSNDKRLRQRAKFLVPNTNNNFVFREVKSEELKNSTLFKKNTQLSTITTGTPYANDLRNQYNYLEEFYSFRWKKVYTVKQFIGRLQKVGGPNADEARGFIGIKDIINAEGVNKFPSNRFDTNINPLYTIICSLLTLFGLVIGFVNGIINLINGLVTTICQIKIPVGIGISLNYCINLPLNIELCYSSTGQNNCSEDCEDTGGSFFSLSLNIKWRCLFSSFLCKKCQPSCPEGETHSCCPADNSNNTCQGPGYGYNGDGNGCSNTIDIPATQGYPTNPSCCCDCCVKVPLIPLRCAEEGAEYKISTIPTPFAYKLCNRTFVVPYSCKNCGGFQTPGIKDWVSCVMEPVAVFLRMLKFDFYNDWVGGTLYFPLIKRKYKLKKSKRKFGQIKKDVFCDFDCRERGGGTNFQGDPTFNQWRIKIPGIVFSNPSITVAGCTAKIKGKRVTDWYGTLQNDSQTFNLNLAVKEFEFKGVTNTLDGCTIKFNNFGDFQNTFNSQGIPYIIKDRELQGIHGKPEYVETDDGNGNTSWENIGGHGHHRNICDNTRLVERKEFFKTTLDCESAVITDSDIENNNLTGNINVEPEEDGGDIDFCDGNNCNKSCSSNGVAPCKKPQGYDDYKDQIIKHGLISWADNEIYYTPYVPPGDPKQNTREYKANLLLPTTIMELGSMSFCDIDDVPFIMDKLDPTTFQASYEDAKVKLGNTSNYSDGKLIQINKLDDKKDISLNLRAYVEFSCVSTVCSNTSAAVNQSQIGVDIVDKNDIGIEIGNCFVRFEHDEEIREYFCRRFNGYKSDRTFHHIRPGGIDTDNIYNTYPEVKLTNATPTYFELPEGDIVLSEFNDGDSFIPGDACGFKKSNGNPDYFYGLAPGSTQNFINYPNGSATLNFGSAPFVDNVDDDVNFVPNVSGIRFNRTQTPYYLYFGLVPGKTSLHKTVALFFGDKINATTLQGVGASNSNVSETNNNSPNIGGGIDNPFTIYKTCLGETLLAQVQVGNPPVLVNNNFSSFNTQIG